MLKRLDQERALKGTASLTTMFQKVRRGARPRAAMLARLTLLLVPRVYKSEMDASAGADKARRCARVCRIGEHGQDGCHVSGPGGSRGIWVWQSRGHKHQGRSSWSKFSRTGGLWVLSAIWPDCTPWLWNAIVLLGRFFQGAEPAGTQGGEDEEASDRAGDDGSPVARRRQLVAGSDDEDEAGNVLADATSDAHPADENNGSAGAYIETVGVVDGGSLVCFSLPLQFHFALTRFAVDSMLPSPCQCTPLQQGDRSNVSRRWLRFGCRQRPVPRQRFKRQRRG